MNRRKRNQPKRKYWGTNWRRKRQSGGFLSRYDFAYAERDIVNQAAKVAPSVIKGTTNDSNIAEQRINQIISRGSKEVERVLPKIFGEAIDDVFQTPFRLLRIFGKQQLNKIKRYYVKILLLILIVYTIDQTMILKIAKILF